MYEGFCVDPKLHVKVTLRASCFPAVLANCARVCWLLCAQSAQKGLRCGLELP